LSFYFFLIVAYLFFASGVNGFTLLLIISPTVLDLGKWESLHGETVTLNGKIKILGFGGTDILKKRGNLSILMKVYQRYHTFKDLQFVMVCPLGTENDIKNILDALDEA
jgi:hypothetical protein